MPRFKHVSGIGKVQFTPEEEKEADEQVIAHEKAQEEYLKIKYKDDRRMNYPDIGDQLDDLFKQGVFSKEMSDKLQKVKTDHPKPN